LPPPHREKATSWLVAQGAAAKEKLVNNGVVSSTKPDVSVMMMPEEKRGGGWAGCWAKATLPGRYLAEETTVHYLPAPGQLAAGPVPAPRWRNS
jgi:hypothetical protein